MHKNADFLQKLQAQAKEQSKLVGSSIIPKQLDWLTSLIGQYPWQFLLIISGISAYLYTYVIF